MEGRGVVELVRFSFACFGGIGVTSQPACLVPHLDALVVVPWQPPLIWAIAGRPPPAAACALCRLLVFESNLVDSASSDTLSLRTKPCMCKYEKYSRLRMAHYISYSLFDSPLLLG